MINLINLIEHASEDAEANRLVKYIPAWFPGAGFQRVAQKFHQTVVESTQLPFAWAKKEIAAGTHISSFTSNALEAGEDEEAVRWTSFALYGGGDDTVRSLHNV